MFEKLFHKEPETLTLIPDGDLAIKNFDSALYVEINGVGCFVEKSKIIAKNENGQTKYYTASTKQLDVNDLYIKDDIVLSTARIVAMFGILDSNEIVDYKKEFQAIEELVQIRRDLSPDAYMALRRQVFNKITEALQDKNNKCVPQIVQDINTGKYFVIDVAPNADKKDIQEAYLEHSDHDLSFVEDRYISTISPALQARNIHSQKSQTTLSL